MVDESLINRTRKTSEFLKIKREENNQVIKNSSNLFQIHLSSISIFSSHTFERFFQETKFKLII